MLNIYRNCGNKRFHCESSEENIKGDNDYNDRDDNGKNRRYHCGSSEHKMKEDYEARALAKAEAKGPKEVPTLLSICNHSLLKD